jgi:hypothetical protein
MFGKVTVLLLLPFPEFCELAVTIAMTKLPKNQL